MVKNTNVNKSKALGSSPKQKCPVCAKRKRIAARRWELFKIFLGLAEIVVILSGMVVHIWL